MACVVPIAKIKSAQDIGKASAKTIGNALLSARETGLMNLLVCGIALSCTSPHDFRIPF